MSTDQPAAATLEHFEAADGIRLSGLLYRPRRRDASAVVWLHGNGDASIFTSQRTSLLGAALTRRGIAFFPFDNRGSHMIKRFRRSVAGETERVEIGMTHELIRESVHDIRGAIRHLRRRGFRRIHLAGHSTGANKICVFHSLVQRGGVRSNILVAGGDDAGLYREDLGRRRYEQALQRARERTARGDGDRLIPAGLSHFPLSWKSFRDTIDPEGDYNVFPFRELLTGERWSRRQKPFSRFRNLRQPTLAIYGSEDEFCFGNVEGCIELLEENRPRRFEVTVIQDADHGFSGMADVLGHEIADWVTRIDGGKRMTRSGG